MDDMPRKGSIIPDMIGKTYGCWTVLGLGDRPYYVHCRCTCGTEKDVYYSSLTTGKSTSCGCHPTGPRPNVTAKWEKVNQQYVGQTINGFRILSASIQKRGQRKSRATYVTAICPKCGRQFTTRLERIKSGVITQCAACARNIGDIVDTVHQYDSVDGTSLSSIKARLNGTLNRNSATGYNGVSQLSDGRYRVYINLRRKQYHLGCYASLSAAIAARKRGEQIYRDLLDSHDGWEEELKQALSEICKEEHKNDN